jgi:hypothetical protein
MWMTAAALAYALVAAPECDEPDRPPDPRCGDSLDGRAPPPATGSSAGRAVLALPHLASQVVFWPILKTSAFVERNKLPQWLRAVTTSDDGLVGVRPELQYVTGFLPSVGLHVFYGRLPGRSQALARFRTAGPDVILGEARLRGPPRWGLEIGGAWIRRRDRLFAGIGPASRDDLAAAGRGVARYAADVGVVEASWSSPGDRLFQFGLGADVEWRNYGTDDVRGGPSVAELYGASPASCAARGLPEPCVDLVLVPGFDARSVARQRGRVALDLRNAGRDASGLVIALDAAHTRGILGDGAHHGRLALETVLALGGRDRALILRGVAAVVEPLGSGFVPFDDLISPSGATGMRGFPVGRFRDRSGIVGTVEWRWLVSSLVDASLFTDAGTVAGPWFAGLRWGNVFPSFGAGLRLFKLEDPRYWKAEPPLFGIQIAYAPEEPSVRLLLTAAAF